jgi:hypothetical protein
MASLITSTWGGCDYVDFIIENLCNVNWQVSQLKTADKHDGECQLINVVTELRHVTRWFV